MSKSNPSLKEPFVNKIRIPRISRKRQRAKKNQPPVSKLWILIALASAVASLLLLIGTTFVYRIQPDKLAGMTIWPQWLLLFPGLALALLPLKARMHRIALVLCLLWIGTQLLVNEEPGMLFRHSQPDTASFTTARAQGRGFRLVTINCDVRHIGGPLDTAKWYPDVIVMQEQPHPKDTLMLARTLWGDHGTQVGTQGACIIANGTIVNETPPFPRAQRWVQAHVKLQNGLEFELFTIHLASPQFNKKVWTPEYWRQYAHFRRVHRAELETVKARTALLPPDMPVVVAGDFNSPAVDGVLRTFPGNMRDLFREAGTGLPGTYPSTTPLLRIDQVWANEKFRATYVSAQETPHSDHRYVVADILLR